MDMKAELKAKGWYLTDEGLDICTEGVERVSPPTVIQKALNIDQREIADHFLSEDIHRGKIESIVGPCVLQIQKIKNASAPKYEYCTGAPPLLRLLLTDGHISINCLQWGNWKSISLDTPPGTKLFIKAVKVTVLNSFLLLNENQFTVLGGYVTAMVEKWKLCRSLASHVRSGETSDGGPPPWIPFGKSINYSTKNVSGNFRSLEQDAKEQKEDAIFKQQRLANIAEVSRAKEGKVKVFGGGKDKPVVSKPGNNGFQQNNQDNNWQYNSDRMNNSTQESENHKHFTTSQRSYKDYNTFSSEKESWQSVPPRFDKFNDQPKDTEKSKRCDSKNALDENDTTLVKQKGFNPTRNVAANSSKINPNTFAYQKNDQGPSSNRYRANDDTKDREHNFKTSQIKIQDHTNNFSFLKNDQGSSSNRYRASNDVEDCEQNFKTSQIRMQENTNNFGDNFSYQKNNQRPPSNRYGASNDAEDRELNYKISQVRMQENVNKFKNHESAVTNDSYLKPGAEVLARYWEDKRFYRAIVHAVGKDAATYVVHFVDYGNYEEVLASDVRPSSNTMWNGQQNSQIPIQGKIHFSGILEFRRGGYKPYVQHGGNEDSLPDRPWDRMQRQESRPAARLYQPPHQRQPC